MDTLSTASEDAVDERDGAGHLLQAQRFILYRETLTVGDPGTSLF